MDVCYTNSRSGRESGTSWWVNTWRGAFDLSGATPHFTVYLSTPDHSVVYVDGFENQTCCKEVGTHIQDAPIMCIIQ